MDTYFHVVFTLPQEIAHLALQNARAIYRILFRAASETLMTIAADPQHLGAEIGFLAVLHTWGQNLHRHEALICCAPGLILAGTTDRMLFDIGVSISSAAPVNTIWAGRNEKPYADLPCKPCNTDCSVHFARKLIYSVPPQIYWC